jgi:transcriptional regulator with XRE-family HTH domain
MIEEEAAPPPGAGDSLRAAREAKGLSLAQVADRTRITQRHLALIEAGEFGQLPGRTYAVGFSRNFAKVVGLDEARIAEQVRQELALIDYDGSGHAARTFEPGDPARVPSSGLAWLAALAALVLLVLGSLFVWRTYVSPGLSLPWLTAEQEAPPPQAATATPAPVPSGQVVFTANEQIWVRFYERGGAVLFERELLAGESYTIPDTAVDPWLITARPDALTVTVGGRQLPPLAAEQDMLDLPVNARALLDRPAPVATPTPTPLAAPRVRAPAPRPAAPSPEPAETPEADPAATAAPSPTT